eukprot:2410071-Amphidinium_carterae.1
MAVFDHGSGKKVRATIQTHNPEMWSCIESVLSGTTQSQEQWQSWENTQSQGQGGSGSRLVINNYYNNYSCDKNDYTETPHHCAKTLASAWQCQGPPNGGGNQKSTKTVRLALRTQ